MFREAILVADTGMWHIRMQLSSNDVMLKKTIWEIAGATPELSLNGSVLTVKGTEGWMYYGGLRLLLLD